MYFLNNINDKILYNFSTFLFLNTLKLVFFVSRKINHKYENIQQEFIF